MEPGNGLAGIGTETMTEKAEAIDTQRRSLFQSLAIFFLSLWGVGLVGYSLLIGRDIMRVISVLFALALILNLSSPAQTGPASLKGEITNVLRPLATFESEGRQYILHLGPLWYWEQENLSLIKGPAEITGEAEEVDGEWHFLPYQIKQGQATIVVRESPGLGSPVPPFVARSR